MDIPYELYKVFYHVAKSLSFSSAAKSLYISQSAVSQSIKLLESKLNTQLFYRNTKKVTLTHEGVLLFQHVEPAVHLLENGQESVLEMHTLEKGQLHIGASDTLCRYYLIPYLNKFHQLYPDIRIEITNRTSIQCVDLLLQEEVDLIVSNLPNPSITKELSVLPTMSFQDYFIVPSSYGPPSNSSLATVQASPYQISPGKVYTLQDLQAYPLLMLDQKTSTSMYLHQLFQKNGLVLEPAVELGSIDLLMDMVKIGLGIALIPGFCLEKKPKNYFILPLEEKLPQREVGVVTHTRAPLSAAAKKFIELLH